MIVDTFIQKQTKAILQEAVFSILIPTWNNIAYLKLCIESIRKNSSYRHQIIVHINDGSDGTLQWVQQQEDIDFVHSTNNIGICYALNGCRSLIATEYVLYMNDDMYVCPEWDKYLEEEIKNIGHPNFFLSATLIEPNDTGNKCVIVNNFGVDMASFNEAALLQTYAQLEKADWYGATWPPNIVHISVWDLVGGYSTEYSPGFYSDPDFSMKLWQLGIRYFKGIGKSKVYHFGSKSTKRIQQPKGYFTFINKWGITSKSFTKNYLKRGDAYTNLLTNPAFSFSFKIKMWYKKIIASFQ